MIQQLPQDPKTLSTYPREIKTSVQTKTCTCMYISALFRIVKRQKQPKYPPAVEWMDKMWYIHRMEYYSALIKKAWNG